MSEPIRKDGVACHPSEWLVVPIGASGYAGALVGNVCEAAAGVARPLFGVGRVGEMSRVVDVHRIGGDGARGRDRVAVEEPLEVRLGRTSLVVTRRADP